MRDRRPPRVAALALLLAAGAGAGCDESFTPQYRVDDLRILSIRAAAPPDSVFADAAPGVEVVRLEALVANPRGRAPVRYRWTACLPALGEGLPPCLDPEWLRRPDRLAEAPGAIVFADGEGLDAVELPVPDVTRELEAIAALAGDQPGFACRPYVELSVVLVVEADGERQVAVKSVRIAATSDPREYVRNANPAVHELRLHPTLESGCDGVLLASECDEDAECDDGRCVGDAPGRRGRCELPPTPLPPGTFDVCAFPDWRRMQRYEVCAPDGARSDDGESPAWQWYVSSGSLDPVSAVGNATGERITVERDGDGPFTLWVLVTDGRGGAGWMRYDAE